MHQLFSSGTRTALVTVGGVATLVYCLSNFVWDIPGQDFRPFRIGTDIAATKQLEQEALAAVQVEGYILTNRADGEVVEMTMDDFLKIYKDYPETDWEIATYSSEPAIEPTKISDFEVTDEEGMDRAADLLAEPGYTFMIVAYALKGEAGEWDIGYLDAWREDIQPVVEQAQSAGHKVVALTKFINDEALHDFRNTIGADYPFYRGDDILLKTIIRSNPGVVLLRNGVIVNKWHHRKLPPFAEIEGRDILAAVE
jgi:hypothetical protein